MTQAFHIHPIGIIHKSRDRTWIDIAPRFEAGLKGLESFSHIAVLYWFDRNDTPESRATLQVHPRRNKSNPLTGVFATHAPVRPNPIAVTVCRLLAIKDRRLDLDAIDALDGSPVIDIKCHIPDPQPQSEVRVPRWVHGTDPH